MKALNRSSLQRRCFTWTKSAKSVEDGQKPALLLSRHASRSLLLVLVTAGARQVLDLAELHSCISDSAVVREAPDCGVLLFLYSHFSTLLWGPSLV